MPRRFWPHLTYANVGVTAALILAAGGFALASIPGANHVISACYQRTGGSLRVIDKSKAGAAGHCSKSEKPLSWNQRGLRGKTGNTGAPGKDGVDGAPGPSRGNFNACANTNHTTTAQGGGIGQADGFVCTLTVVAPAAGKLLISASSQIRTPDSCAGGLNQHSQFITVDSVGTGPTNTQDNVGTGARAYAITRGADVAPGSHTIRYTMDANYGGSCPNLTTLHYSYTNPTVQAVFVLGPS